MLLDGPETFSGPRHFYQAVWGSPQNGTRNARTSMGELSGDRAKGDGRRGRWS